VKVAAAQMPILPAGALLALDLIRAQVERCAALGVDVLCCPEAILGGLADYAPNPHRYALTPQQVVERLGPLSHPEMTLIVGFTEAGGDGRLFNAAAVVRQGKLAGVYRKRHPAVRHSVYSAGAALPVFGTGGAVFGIVICYDSTFPELARGIVAQGASILFIPTNTALPPGRNVVQVVEDARACDVALATHNGITVVRADVAGFTPALSTPGATAITGRDGRCLGAAEPFTAGLVVGTVEPA
jgi:predicted amidohydrolase